jgi:hypothetical protein
MCVYVCVCVCVCVRERERERERERPASGGGDSHFGDFRQFGKFFFCNRRLHVAGV